MGELVIQDIVVGVVERKYDHWLQRGVVLVPGTRDGYVGEQGPVLTCAAQRDDEDVLITLAKGRT